MVHHVGDSITVRVFAETGHGSQDFQFHKLKLGPELENASPRDSHGPPVLGEPAEPSNRRRICTAAYGPSPVCSTLIRTHRGR